MLEHILPIYSKFTVGQLKINSCVSATSGALSLFFVLVNCFRKGYRTFALD